MSTNQTFKSIDEVSQERFKYASTTDAAEAVDLEEIKRMHEDGYKWNCLTAQYAASGGHLECLRYLHENGCSWDFRTTSYAAQGGHLECLQYAYENGCEWNWNTTLEAALNGHLECLQYAHSHGCYWDDECIPAYAAQNGHLDCLRYSIENGCRTDEYITTYAAQNGHLDCLEYAIENGCYLDANAPDQAALNGHIDCFIYCMKVWQSTDQPETFWNYRFNLKHIINKINLDDKMWRDSLFDIDLTIYPSLKHKVEMKKQEIEDLKVASKDILQNKISLDIIKFILQPYF
jgi:hypothetical protein